MYGGQNCYLYFTDGFIQKSYTDVKTYITAIEACTLMKDVVQKYQQFQVALLKCLQDGKYSQDSVDYQVYNNSIYQQRTIKTCTSIDDNIKQQYYILSIDSTVTDADKLVQMKEVVENIPIYNFLDVVEQHNDQSAINAAWVTITTQ